MISVKNWFDVRSWDKDLTIFNEHNDHYGSVGMLLTGIYFTHWILSFQIFQAENYMK